MYKNIFGWNSRTAILPDMRFVMESQELKELSFSIVLGKKLTKFSKDAKYPILGPFMFKFRQK